ncbi:MAG: ATP-binding protein, partial [Gaiellaceae bacterium]
MATTATQTAHSLDLAAGLIETRELIRSTAAEAAMPPERIAEVVLAAHEVAMNALTHGGGHGTMRLWLTGHELVCEIEDEGLGLSNPFTGSEPPDAHNPRGRGLWIARRL